MEEHQDIVVQASVREAAEFVLRQLEDTFKRAEYSPKSSHEEIMYSEGQQSVMNFIRRRILGRNA